MERALVHGHDCQVTCVYGCLYFRHVRKDQSLCIMNARSFVKSSAVHATLGQDSRSLGRPYVLLPTTWSLDPPLRLKNWAPRTPKRGAKMDPLLCSQW